MSNGRAEGVQCRALRRDGSRCRGTAYTASGLCFAHDPSAAVNHSKGGHARSNTARAMRRMAGGLRPIAEALALAIDEVHDGTLDPRRAQAMAALAGALVKVIMVGEHEERLAAVEKRLGIAG